MPSLPADLTLAVVGHLEWVTFLAVNELPSPGQISRAHRSLEEPAGAGAVVAVQLARLTGQKVTFFTALGKDEIGARSAARLRELGVNPIIAWREQPTRRGISLVDRSSDRAITVIGERLTPIADDPLPWELLAHCAGVFVSATDSEGLKLARAAKVLTATPRLRLPILQKAGVSLDALIGSNLDPGERIEEGALTPEPTLRIATEGERGGLLFPGGRFEAQPLPGPSPPQWRCGA